ncbi:MAG TPA: TlpA disulfide reductase family protein [Acidobacteriaceae bacterium]
MHLAHTGRQLIGVAMLACCALLTGACDRGAHPGRIGEAAPEFQAADGVQSVDLASLRGRVVVLNFWATWCAPCIEELPSLERLQRELPQVTVVGISDDTDATAYAQFLKSYRVDFLTVRDPSFRIPRMYGTAKLPETYVIDRQGVVRRKFVSAQDWTSPEIVDYLSKL